MVVFPGKYGRPARTTDGVRHQAAIESHPFLCNAIKVRCFDQLARVTIGADCLISVIVGENEDNVRAFGFCSARIRDEAECKKRGGAKESVVMHGKVSFNPG